MQGSIADLGALLEESEPAFGGLYIDHVPEHRVVVQVADDAEDAVRARIAGGPLEDVIVIQHVDFTWAELLQDLDQARRILGEGAYSLDINVTKNRVQIEVVSLQDYDAIAVVTGFQLPSSAEVVLVDELPRPAVSLYGGLALTTCTSGFTIWKTTSSNRAITTAGHCGNAQSYNGNSLTYQNDEIRTGSHDAQSHKRSGSSYPNWAFDGVCCDSDPYYRSITAKRSRGQQSVGDFVCGYGKVTGSGCGWIVSKVATTCGGGANPANTSIKVDSDPDGTGYDLAESGDSGGPWFTGTTALGTLTCQQGFDAIYVATNYVEVGLGATIATN